MEKIYKGEIQRLFPILEAIKEGKTIQWNDMGVWCDIDGDDEGFVLDTLIGKTDGYRIKPESKYRPFKDAKECWAEMLNHKPFGWVVGRRDGVMYLIRCLEYVSVYTSIQCSFKDAFDKFTFADLVPFGVKIDEQL